MRRASKNVAVYTEEGTALLSFGFDFCSEHDWGIKGIRRSFGISCDEDDLTVGRFAVTRADKSNLQLIEAKNQKKEHRIYLLGGVERFYDQTPEQYVTTHREAYDIAGEPTSLWDERAFMFSVPKSSAASDVVRSIYKALIDKDALIYLARSGNPFGGSGLVIVRRSTVPMLTIQEMEDGFADQKRLKEASDAIGIRDRVNEWGRSKNTFGGAFFALSPRWLKEGFTTKNGTRKSAHPVIYWLNPYDQQNNNSGWYTVEELEQWMQGRGPIPKRPAA